MLIAIQQKGDNRLLEQMKKPTVAYQKVIISGNEKFYLNSDLDNWGIYVVYNRVKLHRWQPVSKNTICLSIRSQILSAIN